MQNQFITHYDKKFRAANGSYPSYDVYSRSSTVIISEDDRKNMTKNLYPGDYVCSGLPLNQRLAPQSVQAQYPGMTLLELRAFQYQRAPDKMLLHHISGSLGNTSPEQLAIIHDMNINGVEPDFEAGKGEIRKVIYKWIEREKIGNKY